jgi:uncharacterized protein YgbK (DUF1537 family)
VEPIVAISDDLTGTLGLSILCENENLPTVAIARYAVPEEIPRTDSVVVVNTDTRRLPAEEVEKRMRALVESVPPEVHIGKRFDTTLRGHLGLELDVILSARPESRALVVPAYPSGGRTTVGGYQLLDGIPVERTEVAHDSAWPVKSGYVPDFFSGTHSVGRVELTVVNEGTEAIREAVGRAFEENRIVVVDAVTDADVESIATAARDLPLEIVPVSTGVFLSTFLRTRYGQKADGFVLAVVGTPTENTKRQLRQLENKARVVYCELEFDGRNEISAATTFDRFVQRFERDATDVLVVRPVGPRVEDRRDEILGSLVELGGHFLDAYSAQITGLFLSGGDTAVGLLEKVEAKRIRPEVEFGSLIMGGRILDGPYTGLKVTTKGGLVGDESTLVRAYTWIQKEHRI